MPVSAPWTAPPVGPAPVAAPYISNSYWLGLPGTLTRIPPPAKGVGSTVERFGGTQQTLAGGRVRDTLGFRRTYKMQWEFLTPDELGVLEQFVLLRGPFRLIDGARRNQLGSNQSLAGQHRRDLTGFAIYNAAGTASATLTDGIRWTSGASTPGPAGVDIGVGTAAGVPGGLVPIVPGKSYSAGVDLTLTAGSATPPALTLSILFMNAAGVLFTQTDSTPVTPTSSSTRLTVTRDSAPASAVYAGLRIYSSSGFAGAVMWELRRPQLEMVSAAQPWVVGTGIPAVVIDQHDPSNVLTTSTHTSMTLLEV